MIHKVEGEVVVVEFQVGVRSWNGGNPYECSFEEHQKQVRTHEVPSKKLLAHEISSYVRVAHRHVLVPTQADG